MDSQPTHGPLAIIGMAGRFPGAALEADAFDSEFFGGTDQGAWNDDPRVRLFLECAHAAAENAGYDVEKLSDFGVFGAAGDGFRLDGLKLGPHGSVPVIATECSDSLVAVHLAAESLLAGRCGLALAGGADLADVAGAGVVALRRLADALADGDPVRAVLRSTAADRPAGAPDDDRCALTSVKETVGPGYAAGVASLIKVALALESGTIPADVDGRPRIAAVDAVGAHVVVEEAPAAVPVPNRGRLRVIVWSGRTAEAADQYRDRLVEHFGGDGERTFLNSVATLQRGRTPYAYRGAVIAADAPEAVAMLRDPESVGHHVSPAPGRDSRIVFLFPGLSAPQAGVARDLYDHSPAYAEAFDECLELFEAEGVPLRRHWQGVDEDQAHSPAVTEPLIFAVEYSLVRAWRAWGITPTAVVGHGVGEIVAATAARVLTLEDAVKAIVARSRAIQDTPLGSLLAVAASGDDVTPYLTDDVRIAVVNGPGQVVLAGPAGAIEKVGAEMEQAGLPCREVPSIRASHTPISAPAVPVFEQAVRAIRLSAPLIEFYSGGTGGLVSAAEATDPTFWSAQLIKPVLFADAVDAATAGNRRTLMIEVGPGRALTTVLRGHPRVLDGTHRVVPTLSQRRTDPLSEVRSALAAMAAVWTEGHAVDWSAVEDLGAITRVPVPGYPYQRTRPHADPAAASASVAAAAAAAPAATTVGRLSGLWTELLGVSDIGPEADFFDLGGNSLTAVGLMRMVRAEFGVGLEIDAVFDYPTLSGLADEIDRGDA